MKTRRNVVLGSIAGAIAIHLVFLACGTPSTPRADGGSDSSSIADAMGDVVDRETGAADAQGIPTPMILEAQCQQLDGGAGAWAVFDVPSVRIGSIPSFTASVCGLPATGFALPPGFQGPQTCIAGGLVWYADGRAATSCVGGATTARLRVE